MAGSMADSWRRPPMLATIGAMQNENERLEVRAHAVQKQASREQDERDLRTGRKSAEQLRQENELLASFARSARVDLAASRSLG